MVCDVFEVVKQQDKIVLEVVDYVVKYLGFVFGNLVSVMNLIKIVFGGGVLKVGEILWLKVEEIFKIIVFLCFVEVVDILIVVFGNDVGVIGGVWIVKNEWFKY